MRGEIMGPITIQIEFLQFKNKKLSIMNIWNIFL